MVCKFISRGPYACALRVTDATSLSPIACLPPLSHQPPANPSSAHLQLFNCPVITRLMLSKMALETGGVTSPPKFPAAAARQWMSYTKWQKQRSGNTRQSNDNRSMHVKQVMLLLGSVGMIIMGSAPTLLVPDLCPPTSLQAEWHDCSLTSLLLSATPVHSLLLMCHVTCAVACCWLLRLVYQRDDWINVWLDAVHTHSYNALSPILHATYGSASADWLLSTLTAINLKTHRSFSLVLAIYLFNTAFSGLWLFGGGGGGWRACFVVLQSVAYPLYTIYSGLVVTHICIPRERATSSLFSALLPPPSGPLAVSLLLTEFVSFNVLDPQKASFMRDKAEKSI
jgi:hypothetical protein